MEWHWVIPTLVSGLLSDSELRGHMKLMAHDHMLVLMENGLLEAHSVTGQLLF